MRRPQRAVRDVDAPTSVARAHHPVPLVIDAAPDVQAVAAVAPAVEPQAVSSVGVGIPILDEDAVADIAHCAHTAHAPAVSVARVVVIADADAHTAVVGGGDVVEAAARAHHVDSVSATTRLVQVQVSN